MKSKVPVKVNEEWIRALSEKLKNVVESCPFENGNPDFFWFYEKLKPITEQVFSAKKEFIEKDQVFGIFHSAAIRFFRDYRESEKAGTVLDVVGSEEVETFVSALTDFYVSIPRKYSLFVRLPQLQREDCGFSKMNQKISGIEILAGEKDQDIERYVPLGRSPLYNFASLADLGKVKRGLGLTLGFYLKIDFNGYAGSHLGSPSVTSAVGLVKQLLYFLYIEKKISFTTSYQPWGGKAEGNIFLIDESSEDRKPELLDVPEDLREILGKVQLVKTEEKKPVEEKKSSVTSFPFGFTAKTLLGEGLGKEVYRYRLPLRSKILEILDAETTNVNAAPMKNAVEWAFDSLMNEGNIKSSLFQISVALEAILGANSDRKNKTVQLANRCAYLIGSSVTDRDKIRKDFEKFYNVRSALIHSGVPTGDSHRWLWWGQGIFDSIVRRELAFLKFSD